MAKNFKELRDKLLDRKSPDERAEWDRRIEKTLRAIPLFDKAAQLTRVELGNGDELAGLKVEDDFYLYLDELREQILAMGGELTVCATFPDGAIDF